MHWRITLAAIDPIGDEYCKEFMIEKDLDGLTDGKLGCSIEDGKAIMKEIQPIAQLASSAPEQLSTLRDRIEPIWWRLWNGQASRALSLIARVRRDLSRDTVPSIWARRVGKLLETLQVYIRRNKGSVVNYAERYRDGKRVSTAPAEACVNRLVTKRIVKKQQMRCSRTGAHYLLKVRASVLNGDLSERTKYEAPKQPIPANISSFISPTSPLSRAA